jgi:hypothetical protein
VLTAKYSMCTLHKILLLPTLDSIFTRLEGCQPKKTKGPAGRSAIKCGLIRLLMWPERKPPDSIYITRAATNVHSLSPRPEAPALADITYRFEAQVPRRILKKLPLHTVHGCTEENFISLQSRLWMTLSLGQDLVFWEGTLHPRSLLPELSSCTGTRTLRLCLKPTIQVSTVITVMRKLENWSGT